MINYSIPKKANQTPKPTEYKNRGMTFEEMINTSNAYYREIDKAVIYKKPTPIHIIKMDNTQHRISEAVFEQPSTTDYNGIYKGKYIDFEAKEAKNKTSFPLKNIHEHQIRHLMQVQKHGGIAFVLIRFTTLDEVYLLDARIVSEYYFGNERQSIPYSVIIEKGHLVKYGYVIPVNYLEVIDHVYLP